MPGKFAPDKSASKDYGSVQGSVPARRAVRNSPEQESSSSSSWRVARFLAGNELLSTAAPFTYLVLYCIYDILAAWSAKHHGGYYLFNPVCCVLVVEMGKLFVTLAILVVYPPQEEVSAAKLFYNVGALLCVAMCYTAINVINLICLATVSLSHYAVWYQTGIFFNALLWWIAFRRPFGLQRSFALVVLFLGCALNALGPEMNITLGSMVPLVVGSSFISAVGCVLNEYFYKKDNTRLDLNLQNAILYSETSLFCVILLFCIHREKLMSWGNFFAGFGTDCWALVGVQIFIGLTVSRILKYTSIITKNYVTALHVPVEVIAAHYVIGTHLGLSTVASTLLIGASTCLYYTAGVSAAPDVKKEGRQGDP